MATDTDKEIEIYLEGLPSQRQTVSVISRKDGIIETETEGGIKGRFRSEDGLACDASGEPNPWSFWRAKL